jgi:hypothetical protein
MTMRWPFTTKDTQSAGSATARSLPASGGADVLPFPETGYAQLTRLCRDLRRRLAQSGANPGFIVEVAPGPVPRLRIDGDAFAEFDGERRCYRFTVQASEVTQVILETSDFSRVEEFAARYIVDRITASTVRAFLP